MPGRGKYGREDQDESERVFVDLFNGRSAGIPPLMKDNLRLAFVGFFAVIAVAYLLYVSLYAS